MMEEEGRARGTASFRARARDWTCRDSRWSDTVTCLLCTAAACSDRVMTRLPKNAPPDGTTHSYLQHSSDMILWS